MGLLDRFKKAPGPDAMTLEAVARLRAVADVARAEAVDADTVEIAWVGNPYTSTLSLAATRDGWSRADGFDRIEIMDALIAAVAPPTGPPEGTADGFDPTPPDVAPDIAASPVAAAPPEPDDDDTDWARVEGRLRVVVGRTGPGDDAISWPVAGVLTAHVTIDSPGGLAVGAADAATWGVGADDVREAALANLAASDPSLDPIGPGQPAWVPTAPADHPPVWLAAPARLLAACGLDEAVVLAPMPTELVVVDPTAHELLASILTSTKAMVAGDGQVLWPAPLLVTADGVGPWQPDPGHPCAALAAELARG